MIQKQTFNICCKLFLISLLLSKLEIKITTNFKMNDEMK